ncbi:hypothetical protein ACFC0M_33025 [Streptomyces sp. NPDC056149]|uniref:hypothetical protein n=1 Tax=unclassified Streptomyces TaxID=2593676 RepID=UPI0023815A46|nr:hypothetical protein [Streptomyces sp. WZ-12]
MSHYPEDLPSGRPTEFGDLSPFTLERHEYLGISQTPVHFFPVLLRGQLIGYLWASESESEDAAGFFPRRGAGATGFDAGGTWRGRLKRARETGMTPLTAMRQWVGEPEDSRGGGVPTDAEERVLENSRAVQALANQVTE